MAAQLGTTRDAQHLLALMDYEAAFEQRLWLTVVATTIVDALATDEDLHRGRGASTFSRPLARERAEARHVLTAPAHRQEREALCCLAGFEPGFLCRLGHDLAAAGWVGPPGLRENIRAALAHGAKAEQLAGASARAIAGGPPQARRTRSGDAGDRRHSRR